MLTVAIYLFKLNVIKLCAVMLNAVLLSFIMLNVMAPLADNSVGVFSSVKRSSLFFSSPSNDIDT